MTSDSHIRGNPEWSGRAAYEASCRCIPTYDDGSPRKAWDDLPPLVQWSWIKPYHRANAMETA